MIEEIDLLNCPTLFDAIRKKSQRSITSMSHILQLSYQTVRRLCSEPGTPRTNTLESVRSIYPFVNSARWRRWVYLISRKFDMDVLEELNDLLNPGSIELDKHVRIADTAAKRDLFLKSKARAVSFYLHEDHIEALSLLAAKLGKSQAQLIRDHIDDLLTKYKDISCIVHHNQPVPQDDSVPDSEDILDLLI